MIHEAFATDPTPDLPLNVGFGSLSGHVRLREKKRPLYP
jgi:hypothetical protein